MESIVCHAIVQVSPGVLFFKVFLNGINDYIDRCEMKRRGSWFNFFLMKIPDNKIFKFEVVNGDKCIFSKNCYYLKYCPWFDFPNFKYEIMFLWKLISIETFWFNMWSIQNRLPEIMQSLMGKLFFVVFMSKIFEKYHERGEK